jgi:hypothetical protein
LAGAPAQEGRAGKPDPGQERPPAPAISAERIKAAVAHLASDRLEGRAPGTRGVALTTEHLADEFRKAGLKPAGERGTYFQPVPSRVSSPVPGPRCRR